MAGVVRGAGAGGLAFWPAAAGWLGEGFWAKAVCITITENSAVLTTMLLILSGIGIPPL
jgi:hypothetical protein